MLLRVAAVAAVAACGGTGPAPGCPRFAGTQGAAVELLGITLDPDGSARALQSGAPVYLQAPPQGGYVLYVGVAARNLQACGVQLTAELLDASGAQPITNLDQRRADLTVASAGYFWPANLAAQTPNVPACPNALGKGIAGQNAILRVDVLDTEGRSSRLELPVAVACAPGDARCPAVCG